MSDEKLDKLLQGQEALTKSVLRLNNAVLGDEEAGSKGLGVRVTQLEVEVEDVRTDLTNRLSWLKGGAWLASVLMGLLAFFKDKIF
jgi:hypothetical protein